jgi:hypothetical protein
MRVFEARRARDLGWHWVRRGIASLAIAVERC